MDVLITGATGGIGRATVDLLIRNGYRVFAADFNREALEALETSDQLIPIYLDVTDHQSIEEAHDKVAQHTNGLDGLVNNAGRYDQFPLVEGSTAQFEQMIKVNVLAAQHMTRAFFPLLYQRKGRIVNISSESALALMPLQVYAMTKKMLEAHSNVLRQELGLLDMKVIVIRPGAHLTPFIKRSYEVLDEVNEQSLYANALKNVKREGQKILNKTHHAPSDVAEKIYRGLSHPNPKNTYHVNVSWTFNLLRMIPAGWRAAIFKAILKRSA